MIVTFIESDISLNLILLNILDFPKNTVTGSKVRLYLINWILQREFHRLNTKASRVPRQNGKILFKCMDVTFHIVWYTFWQIIGIKSSAKTSFLCGCHLQSLVSEMSICLLCNFIVMPHSSTHTHTHTWWQNSQIYTPLLHDRASGTIRGWRSLLLLWL